MTCRSIIIIIDFLLNIILIFINDILCLVLTGLSCLLFQGINEKTEIKKMLQLIQNVDVYLSSLTADLANSQVGLDFHFLLRRIIYI